jgi:hypothetical protein
MVKRELKLAYALAIALLVVGVVCFSVPAKVPDQPLRVMFQSVAGRVLFDHRTHLGEGGYGISCQECHHHPSEGTDTRGCGVCHQLPLEGKIAPGACFDCHEAEDMADSKITKRADAFHAQCIKCHKENDAGPVECSGCHIL